MADVFLLFLDQLVFLGDLAFELVIQLLEFQEALSLFGVDLLEYFPETVRFVVDLLRLGVLGRQALVWVPV